MHHALSFDVQLHPGLLLRHRTGFGLDYEDRPWRVPRCREFLAKNGSLLCALPAVPLDSDYLSPQELTGRKIIIRWSRVFWLRRLRKRRIIWFDCEDMLVSRLPGVRFRTEGSAESKFHIFVRVSHPIDSSARRTCVERFLFCPTGAKGYEIV